MDLGRPTLHENGAVWHVHVEEMKLAIHCGNLGGISRGKILRRDKWTRKSNSNKSLWTIYIFSCILTSKLSKGIKRRYRGRRQLKSSCHTHLARGCDEHMSVEDLGRSIGTRRDGLMEAATGDPEAVLACKSAELAHAGTRQRLCLFREMQFFKLN